MNYILFVAFKMLFERRRQTLVSVLGVSVGVCAFIVMSSLMLGFQNYFIQQVIDLEPHIKIKPREEAQEVEKYTILLGAKPKEKDRILGWQEIIKELEENNGYNPFYKPYKPMHTGIVKRLCQHKPISQTKPLPKGYKKVSGKGHISKATYLNKGQHHNLSEEV